MKTRKAGSGIDTAARNAVLAAQRWHGRSMCFHCGGGSVDCPGCGQPTVPPANGAKYCHRCGSRLDSVYEEAKGAGMNPSKSKSKSKSKTGISPAARAAYLDARLPVHERIRLTERSVELCEADSEAAAQALRQALADLPKEARATGATLDDAVASIRRNTFGRVMPEAAASAYRAVFDCADTWQRTEAALRSARRAQSRLLEKDAGHERAMMAAMTPGDWDRLENRPECLYSS